jgi:hypothetical protein
MNRKPFSLLPEVWHADMAIEVEAAVHIQASIQGFLFPASLKFRSLGHSIRSLIPLKCSGLSLVYEHTMGRGEEALGISAARATSPALTALGRELPDSLVNNALTDWCQCPSPVSLPLVSGSAAASYSTRSVLPSFDLCHNHVDMYLPSRTSYR